MDFLHLLPVIALCAMVAFGIGVMSESFHGTKHAGVIGSMTAFAVLMGPFLLISPASADLPEAIPKVTVCSQNA